MTTVFGYSDPPRAPTESGMTDMELAMKHLIRPTVTLVSNITNIDIPLMQAIPKSYVSPLTDSNIVIFDYHGQNLLTGEATGYKSAKQAIMDLAIIKRFGIQVSDDQITINDRNGPELKKYLEDTDGMTLVKRFSIQSGIIGGGVDSQGHPILVMIGRCNTSGQPGFLHALLDMDTVVTNKGPDSEVEIIPYTDPADADADADADEADDAASTSSPEPEVDIATIYQDLRAIKHHCVMACAHLGQYVINKVRSLASYISRRS